MTYLCLHARTRAPCPYFEIPIRQVIIAALSSGQKHLRAPSFKGCRMTTYALYTNQVPKCKNTIIYQKYYVKMACIMWSKGAINWGKNGVEDHCLCGQYWVQQANAQVVNKYTVSL